MTWPYLRDMDVEDIARIDGLAAILIRLPEMPDSQDDLDEPRELVLYLRDEDVNVYLKSDISLADAREYASREDTHDPGDDPAWFVGFDRQ